MPIKIAGAPDPPDFSQKQRIWVFLPIYSFANYGLLYANIRIAFLLIYGDSKMTSDIGSKFIQYVESLENTGLTKIASGEMAIEYDPEAIDFQMVIYHEDNLRIVADGDVAGTSEYHELWVKVLGFEDYDQSDCRDLSDEQMLEVANFERRKLIGSVEHVAATVDVINERYSHEMEESE